MNDLEDIEKKSDDKIDNEEKQVKNLSEEEMKESYNKYLEENHEYQENVYDSMIQSEGSVSLIESIIFEAKRFLINAIISFSLLIIFLSQISYQKFWQVILLSIVVCTYCSIVNFIDRKYQIKRLTSISLLLLLSAAYLLNDISNSFKFNDYFFFIIYVLVYYCLLIVIMVFRIRKIIEVGGIK